MTRVLIVEDEVNLARGVAFNLELEGCEVETVADGSAALELLTASAGDSTWDLIIMDVMLPGVDGVTIVKRMRGSNDFTPVLMLTAKGQPDDVVRGFEAGADDYLAKPFDLAVLLARVKGLLRRRDWARDNDSPAEQAITVGEAEVRFEAFELQTRGQTVRLTTLEAAFLRHLVDNAGRVVTKGEILEQVWHVSPETETRAVDNFVVRLRRHIEPNPRFPTHLLTVRGAGYKLLLDP